MSSLHIHLHIARSCQGHDSARHGDAGKGLRQSAAAMIVLALFERMAHATSQGGGAKTGHGHCHDTKPPAMESSGHAGQVAAVQPRSLDGDDRTGVLQQFTALLILLALLFGHKGGHGGANRLAGNVADKLEGRLADPLADSSLGESEAAPEAEVAGPQETDVEPALTGDDAAPFEDPVSMMLSAMREGHAESLLAGQDAAGFERSLQAMASDLRQQLSAG